MFDSDLEVDVLALQTLSSPSSLMESEMAGLGGHGHATCAQTMVCAGLSVQVLVCCVTVQCNNTVCVINTQI